MVNADQILFVERVIDYSFSDKSIVVSALTAAHRSDDHASTDGNRRLTRFGEAIINLII